MNSQTITTIEILHSYGSFDQIHLYLFVIPATYTCRDPALLLLTLSLAV